MRVIDLHCDTINRIFRYGECLKENTYNIDIQKLKKGNYAMQCFALFYSITDLDKIGKSYWQEFLDMYDTFRREMDLNKEDIEQVFTYNDILRCQEQGKLAALLTVEEGACIDGKLERIKEMYDKGVRIVTLTWCHENCLGYPGSEDPVLHAKGLKPFGIEAVEEMNRVGIIVDVSHLSDGGFYDVAKYSKRPFIATHSDARSRPNNWPPRNLSDDMIKVLSNKGGVIGTNFFTRIITTGDKTMVSDIVDDIKYVKNVGGIDCIAIGTDFDGIAPTLEIDDAGKMPLLYDGLQKAGFSEDEIDKIFYGNAMRVFKEFM